MMYGIRSGLVVVVAMSADGCWVIRLRPARDRGLVLVGVRRRRVALRIARSVLHDPRLELRSETTGPPIGWLMIVSSAVS